MTIGDVLAVLAAIVALFVSWICAILLLVYVAPNASDNAASEVAKFPTRCGLIGLATALLVTVVTLILLSTLVGLAKLIPLAVIGVVIAFAGVGSAGIVKLIARRIGGDKMSFATLRRAASIYALAGLFPLAGWFVILPVAIIVSIGAGVSALLRHTSPKASTEIAVAPSFSEAV